MAERDLEVQTGLAEAVARLDLLESRMSSLEESVNTAVVTLMPKVDSLLSGSTDVRPSESTSTSSEGSPSRSVLDLAEQGDGEALLQLLAVEQIDVRSNPQRTDKGDTALHVAVNGGHLKAVMALLGAGAKADEPGHRLRTPLHCAVVQGHLAVAQRLLDIGAQVNAKDADGAIPLDLAAGLGSKDAVHLLLKKGTQLKESAVCMAAENGHWNLVEWFLEMNVHVDACNKEGHPLIVLAAKSDRWEIVDLLMEKGASVTKCKDPKESALVYASRSGRAHAVRELLRRGAALVPVQTEWAIRVTRSAAVVWAFKELVPGQMSENIGKSGLVTSGRDGRYNSLVAFLEAGVDINSTSFNNYTSLHLAAFNGQIKCVKELLHRGADPNVSNEEGNTPLHLASSKGHVNCLRALLDSGANTSAENKEGKTPRDVAHSDAVRAVFNGEQ